MTVRDVVGVRGPDAATFLQGQLSQDVGSLTVGSSVPSFLLSPQGRVDAWLVVRRAADDSFELVVDEGWGATVEARLRRFMLRTKVELERGATDDATAPAAAERIIAGVPAMGAEIDERTIPAETGWVDASVSFTKGCFVGQELVARMDSRSADPPRRLVRLRIHGPEDQPFERGTPILVAGIAAGEITSSAWSVTDACHVALGYVRRGTDLGGATRVEDHDASIEGPAGA